MNKTKIYWKWDNSLDVLPFNLGEDVGLLLEKNLIFKGEDGRYYARDSYPWSFNFSDDNKVKTIGFREIFPTMFVDNLWDLQKQDFIKIVDKHLVRCEEDEKGNVFFAFFRANFVAVSFFLQR